LRRRAISGADVAGWVKRARRGRAGLDHLNGVRACPKPRADAASVIGRARTILA
jgi:hypothetical protein